MDFKLKINHNLKDMDKDYKDGLLKGVRQAMFVAEAWAKGSFGKPGHLKARTGNLRRSINTKVVDKGNQIVGTIGSAVIYAAIHELGGKILPKKGKYLKFAIDGHWISVKQVNIPARPYLAPSIESNINKIRDIIKNSVIQGANK